MKVADFDYDLPQELIAQEPLAERDRSRLLLLDRQQGKIGHRRFDELPQLLSPGDLLVLNDTRVLPARLSSTKPTGGRVEALLLERAGGTDTAPLWSCLLQASRSLRPGTRLQFDDALRAEVVERQAGRYLLRFEAERGDPADRLARLGRMPLPPYIDRQPQDPRDALDRRRYQTIYARRPGAVAAPTAGLHFTDELLARLGGRGVERAFVTLHVGPGTFLPVRAERVEDHVMHEEWFDLPAPTAEAVGVTRQRGGRVVAVGTTVVRTLEHGARGGERVAGVSGSVESQRGRCGLFIYPGYEFRAVDLLITNFHLPRSTLLMLVCAFAGRETVLAAYQEAIREGYRFYSYGDAMMLGDGLCR